MIPLAIGGLGIPELLILLVIPALAGPLLLILALATRPKAAAGQPRPAMGGGRVVAVVFGAIGTAITLLIGLIVILQLT